MKRVIATAAFALGLTPVAFMIAGLIFVCTAATYAEATVMYPEAGGSSSFGRHAFNEMVSFIAAWAQMLNYTITVAISAYFVPHYLAVFWPALGHAPGDIVGGALVIVFLAWLNIRGGQESARLNIILAVADLATQVILVGIGMFLVFNTDVLISNIHLGVAPTWPDFALGNRYDYYYVQGKLRSDPLYPGAFAALRGSSAPLLDLREIHPRQYRRHRRPASPSA